jgi:hypothetical protein
MKALAATAASETNASQQEAYALLAHVEGYPSWYPSGVRDAEVLELGPDGKPAKVKATLHAAVGPLVRDFKLHLAVITDEPERIELRRLPHDSRDREEMTVVWTLAPQSEETRIQVDLRAKLSIPALVPTGGVADQLARGFLDAALDALR